MINWKLYVKCFCFKISRTYFCRNAILAFQELFFSRSILLLLIIFKIRDLVLVGLTYIRYIYSYNCLYSYLYVNIMSDHYMTKERFILISEGAEL